MDDLHRAALMGDTEACRDLILKGVKVDAQESGDLWTPLRCAVAGGHVAASVCLVEAGATLDIADKHGWTPIAHAQIKKPKRDTTGPEFATTGPEFAAVLRAAHAKWAAYRALDALAN